MEAGAAWKLGRKLGLSTGGIAVAVYSLGAASKQVEQNTLDITEIKIERKADRSLLEKLDRRLWRMEYRAKIPANEIEPLEPPED